MFPKNAEMERKGFRAEMKRSSPSTLLINSAEHHSSKNPCFVVFIVSKVCLCHSTSLRCNERQVKALFIHRLIYSAGKLYDSHTGVYP